MNIVLLYSGQFPIAEVGSVSGQAQLNRILSYLSEFAKQHHNINVVITRPVNPVNIRTLKVQKFNGINYFLTAIKPNSNLRIVKHLAILKSIAMSNFRILKLYFQSGISTLIIQDNSFFVRFNIYVVSRLLLIKLFRDESEYPFLGLSNTGFQKINYYLKTNLTYKFFDGLFVMTESLSDYLSSRIRKNANIQLIPMTVDNSRFLVFEKKEFERDFIAYCGDMSGTKDGVPTLVKAFSIIAPIYDNIDLHLIGSANEKDFEGLRNLVQELGLSNRVIFAGVVGRDDIPKYLSSAKILTLARPANIQAQGGFPTKLGEYLATGRPVVVTKVGEIPLYLMDKMNAVLCDPDNPVAFAQGLRFLLDNPELATIIGIRGKELANSVFDSQLQAKKMINFITKYSN